MKIFGYEIRKSAPPTQELIAKPQISYGTPQGPYTAYFQNYCLRKVTGDFYEFLREGIPIIDSAIRRLISLNGTIKIIGNNGKIVNELNDFCRNVPVNDTQKGIHSFLENFSNETFEQGFSISEFIVTPDFKDIAGLRVADSKNIVYRRNQEGIAEPWYRFPYNLPLRLNYMPGALMDRIMNANYGQVISIQGIQEIKLNPANLFYHSINNENTDPYGVSMMRSMEFVSQILVTLQNSMKNVAERFGDPSYHVHYKSAKVGSGDNLETRRAALQTDFNNVINAKRSGQSADLVTAGSMDSEVVINVIGHQGQILTYEIPVRHVLEQIVSKTNLPAWMLGIYFSTTERMATLEVEAALQDAKIRNLTMVPEFIRLFSVYLMLRGYKWNTITTDLETPGDWGFVFETPNLRDLVAQAQSRFLNAQADMMKTGAAATTQTTVPMVGAHAEIAGIKIPLYQPVKSAQKACGCGDHDTKEVQRPVDWPQLDKIEADYEAELKYDWAELQGNVFHIIRLPQQKGAQEVIIKDDEQSFTFSEEQRVAIKKALKDYLDNYNPKNSDSSVNYFYGQAMSVGYIAAANMVGKDRPLLDILKNKEIYDQLRETGFQYVKDDATKAIIDQIIPEMEAQMTAGSNPIEVADRLEKLFGDQNSDWERLARTEMSQAAEQAKLDEWDAWKVKRVEFTPAPDACAICEALAGDYDIASAPVPGRDTHPRCRCANRPAASEVTG